LAIPLGHRMKRTQGPTRGDDDLPLRTGTDNPVGGPQPRDQRRQYRTDHEEKVAHPASHRAEDHSRDHFWLHARTIEGPGMAMALPDPQTSRAWWRLCGGRSTPFRRGRICPSRQASLKSDPQVIVQGMMLTEMILKGDPQGSGEIQGTGEDGWRQGVD